MGINKIMNTSAYYQSMQYGSGISDMQKEEGDIGLPEAMSKDQEEFVDMDQIDFEEGDRAISQIRQSRGKGVYQTVSSDPALAWSVKRQTYPSALRVDKKV